METAVTFAVALAVVSLLCAVVWYGIRFEFWAAEKGFRAFEKAMLRALTRAKVRPDYWDMAMLAWIYSRLAAAFMVGGLLHYAGGGEYGIGVFIVAFAVWGVAEKVSDHAMKPRPITDPYMLMWWECGRLHPPPYVTFG